MGDLPRISLASDTSRSHARRKPIAIEPHGPVLLAGVAHTIFAVADRTLQDARPSQRNKFTILEHQILLQALVHMFQDWNPPSPDQITRNPVLQLQQLIVLATMREAAYSPIG